MHHVCTIAVWSVTCRNRVVGKQGWAIMDEPIYKICARGAWENACRAGHFTGSTDDLRDGFIHFSTAEQLEGTLAKHFSGQADLVLVQVDPRALAMEVRWEASTGGKLYPHLYGPLPTAAAVRVSPLPLGADGRHSLPEGFDAC